MTKKTKSNTKKNTGLKKIKELEEIIDESKDKYLRLAAEYDNYRKRSLEEKLDATDNGKKIILKSIIPILDDFERAEKANQNSKEDDGFLLIKQKLIDALKKEGLEKIKSSIGKEFDINKHEAITQVPAPKKNLKGKIVDEIESGYTLNEKVIRFTKVVIGK
tara:strand:- start:448 stop:933 length:486 start_codon:yes stop_codon:yes gene_type:complete